MQLMNNKFNHQVNKNPMQKLTKFMKQIKNNNTMMIKMFMDQKIKLNFQ